jgi:hypothetical protein
MPSNIDYEKCFAVVQSVLLDQEYNNGTANVKCHFVTFDSSIGYKTIPNLDFTGIPNSSCVFLDPADIENTPTASLFKSKLLDINGLAPAIIRVNKTGASDGTLPAYTMAVGKWLNPTNWDPVGKEVYFNSFTNTPVPSIPRIVPTDDNLTPSNAVQTSALVYPDTMVNDPMIQYWFFSRRLEGTQKNNTQFRESIENRTSSIRAFDRAKVVFNPAGANNKIQILEGGVTYVYRDLEVEGFPATISPHLDVTGITNGYVYGIYNPISQAKSYQALAKTTTRPTDGLILFEFTNTAGIISFTNSLADFENVLLPIQTNIAINQSNISFLTGTNRPLPKGYHDMKIDWVNANQIRIKAGSRCRSEDDTVNIVFNNDYIIDMTNTTPTSTLGGRTVAEVANTQYYPYVGLDANGLGIGFIDTANLSAGGSPTNPASYSSGRKQVKISIYNNSSSDIAPFIYSNNSRIDYRNIVAVYTTASLGGTPVTVDASAVIPSFARVGLFLAYHASLASLSYLQVRAETTGDAYRVAEASAGVSLDQAEYSISLNSSQQHSINALTNASATTIYCKGYIIQ